MTRGNLIRNSEQLWKLRSRLGHRARERLFTGAIAVWATELYNRLCNCLRNH